MNWDPCSVELATGNPGLWRRGESMTPHSCAAFAAARWEFTSARSEATGSLEAAETEREEGLRQGGPFSISAKHPACGY